MDLGAGPGAVAVPDGLGHRARREPPVGVGLRAVVLAAADAGGTRLRDGGGDSAECDASRLWARQRGGDWASMWRASSGKEKRRGERGERHREGA